MAEKTAASLKSILRRLAPGFVAAGLTSIFVTLAQLAVPVYMIQVFTRVLTSRSEETLVLLTLITVGALIVFVVLDALRQAVHMRLGSWLGERLGMEALEPLVRRTLGNKGDASRVLGDLNALRSFVSGRSFTVLFDFLWSPIFLVVLAFLHPAYAIVCGVGAVLMLFLGVLNELLIHHPHEQSIGANAAASSRLGSALRNAESIEAMGILPALARRWHAETRTAADAAELVNRRGQALSGISKFVRLAVQIAVMATGAILIIQDETIAGSMMAAMIISRNMLGPFESMIDGWRQWVSAFGSYRRINELLTTDTPQRSSTPLPRPEGGLVVERLVFVPGGASRAVLHGVSMTAGEGETVAVMGPSASGKSTLARMLVGVWPPTSGAVRLGGHDVFSWDRGDFGRHVGYLPQDVELFAGTVRENIARMTDGDPAAVIAAAKEAGIHEMIGALPHGYDTDIGPGGYPLTGGQRQRVALARAVYGNPALLVLDEPDASLDTAGEQALRTVIAAAKARGTTVVVVTHRNSLLPVFDKILFLQEGKVALFGNRDAVLKRLGGRTDEASPAKSLPVA